jgi:hypothetical protein
MVNSKSLYQALLIISFIALSWGSLILAYTIVTQGFNDNFTFIDGLFLIIVGTIGVIIGLRLSVITKNHKWYEDLPKKV